MNRMAVTPDRAPLARLVKRIMLHSGSGHCHVTHGRLLVGWRETPVEQPKPARMNRDEFRRWVEEQGGQRFERVAGEPVAMSPERLGHVRLKYRVWQALDAALAEGGLGCEAIGDGATVEINEDVDYEPDVLVECGDRTSNDALAASSPTIVVEVLSRGTRGVDTGAKLGDYFSVSSIMHYLIWHADRKLVVHHRRDGADYHTRILHGGTIELVPPGVSIDLDAVYQRAGIG
jgi:Uma2 family endonuclease